MRVAIIVDEPPTTGIGKYSVNLRDGIRRNGVDADLVYVRWSSRPLREADSTARIVSPFPLRLRPQSLELLFAARRADRFIPRGYDVYHAAQQFLVLMLPSFGTSLATFHDLAPLERPEYFPALLRYEYKSVVERGKKLRLLIADTRQARDAMCKIMGLEESRMKVINLGVSEVFKPRPSSRRDLHLPPDKRIIIHVGAEDGRKNIPFLLRVFHELSKGVDNMLLVRIGKMTQASKELIRQLALEDKVVYVTGISDEVLSSYYSASDALLFPSLYEGFGLPPLEAMASGCPVVCSDASSLPEIVGKAGIVLPPSDMKAWVEATRSLLEDDELRERLIGLGLEQAKKFTWDRCAKETIAAYEEAQR